MPNFLSRLLEARDNPARVTFLFTEILKVSVSESTIKKEIEEHPDYPSLFCISDVLSRLGVENIATRCNEETLDKIPTPFITQVKGKKTGEIFFTIVRSTKGETVEYFDQEKYSWLTAPKADFLARCNKIVLFGEAKQNAGEKNYEQKIRVDRKNSVRKYFYVASIPALILSAGIYSAFLQWRFSWFMFFTLAFLGLMVSLLLIWYEFDQHSPLLSKICTTRKKINCGLVLQSKAAKLWGIGWNIWGFSYFSGLVFCMLINKFLAPDLPWGLQLINIAALPYVIYSIYTQWRVLKQWCVLCLAVISILLCQAILLTMVFGLGFTLPISRGLDVLLPFLFTSTITLILTQTIFSILKRLKDKTQEYRELVRLKRNAELFNILFSQQPAVTNIASEIGIKLGNPLGKYKIIKVCNPYCNPCSKSHASLETLLDANSNVQVQVVFSVSNSEDDFRAQPVRHFLALSQESPELLKEAMDYWYAQDKKDYQIFASRYPINWKDKNQNHQIDAMRNWCTEVDIRFTPTVFLSEARPDQNGEVILRQLPEFYAVEELNYFFANP